VAQENIAPCGDMVAHGDMTVNEDTVAQGDLVVAGYIAAHRDMVALENISSWRYSGS
jgi:hypothetical protein